MPEGGRILLIPAKTPGRAAVERALRKGGWELLAYEDARQAERALSRGPATAVVLFLPDGEPDEGGLLGDPAFCDPAKIERHTGRQKDRMI
jgi:hypothetical protein